MKSSPASEQSHASSYFSPYTLGHRQSQESWSDDAQVFDGARAGFKLVPNTSRLSKLRRPPGDIPRLFVSLSPALLYGTVMA